MAKVTTAFLSGFLGAARGATMVRAAFVPDGGGAPIALILSPDEARKRLWELSGCGGRNLFWGRQGDGSWAARAQVDGAVGTVTIQ